MRVVYDICYAILLLAFSPWLVWRFAILKKNRRGWRQKLLGLVPVRSSNSRCLWLHAVSVGEVNLLTPFVQEFSQRFPDFEIAVSATTESGFDLAKQKFPQHIVFFCPADFSWAVANTVKRLRPTALLLTELELWPNLISVSRSAGVPVALINGRISESSFRGYRRWNWLTRFFIQQLDLAIMQTPTCSQRIQRLGVSSDRIIVCGNLKFDNGIARKQYRSSELATLSGIAHDDFVFLCGSTQESEDILALDALAPLMDQIPKLRMILAPRHPARCNRLVESIEAAGLRHQLRSGLGSSCQSSSKLDWSVLVIDCVGELADWWGTCHAGFVGGSMGKRGGQSMIEPAARGVPVCFGPNTDNFRDVVRLMLENDAASVVRNAAELRSFAQFAINDPDSARAMGTRAKRVTDSQTGATAKTVDAVEVLLSSTPTTNRAPQRAA